MAITIPIISEFDGKGISRAVQEFKQLEGAGAKAQFAIKKAAIPAAAALGGLALAAGSAAKAAIEDAAGAAELSRQLKISTQATDAQVQATEDMISKMTLATGVADSDLRTALANLARSTGSAEESTRLLNLAMDISAATGKDLDSVSQALGKAFNGQTTALAKLDPSLRGIVKEGASADEVFKIMADTFGGAAAEAANTASGRFARMNVALGEAQESIGQALLPIIEKFLPYLESLATWVGENTTLVTTFGVVIGTAAAAIIGINAAMKAWAVVQAAATAAQVLFNAAMNANPIVLATTAIVAIGAAVVVAYKKFETFRNIVDGIADVFQGAFSGVVKIVKNVFDAYVGIYRGLFNKIADIWNATVGGFGFDIPDWVPGLGGKGFKIPEIPKLAMGGIVDKPTLALIGEAGPEAVVPLNRAGEFGLGAGGPFTINVHGGDPESVVDALRKYMRMNGSVPIRVGNAY